MPTSTPRRGLLTRAPSLVYLLVLLLLVVTVGYSAARHYHVVQALAGIGCVLVVVRWLRVLDRRRRT